VGREEDRPPGDRGLPGQDQLADRARGWDEDGIGRAIRVVAAADAAIKGKAHDASYALEKMVLDVVRARPQRP
jgi:DNA polymerase-3 subunit delta